MHKQVVVIVGIGSHVCANSQEVKPAILSPQSRILLVRFFGLSFTKFSSLLYFLTESKSLCSPTKDLNMGAGFHPNCLRGHLLSDTL